MSTSPFKRRPTLSKTYGKRSSLPSTSRSTRAADHGNPQTDLAKFLLDSEDDSSDLSELEDEEDVVTSSRGGKKEVKAVQQKEGGKRKDVGRSSARQENTTVSGKQSKEKTDAAGRRRSPRKSGNGTLVVEKDTTNWDEGTVTIEKPVIEKLRRTRSMKATSGKANKADSKLEQAKSSTFPSPPVSKRPRLSRSVTKESSTIQTESATTAAPQAEPLPVDTEPRDAEYPDPPSPPSRRRPRRSAPARTTAASERISTPLVDDDEIPPPFDYVPLTQRTKSNAGQEALPPVEAIEDSKEMPAPIITETLPSSSSPTKAVEPASTSVRNERDRRNDSRNTPSPAKDLSSLFSSFAKPSISSKPRLDVPKAKEVSAVSSARAGLKRTASGGLVASMTARSESQGRNSRASTPVSPFDRTASPSRLGSTGLERSQSQPGFGSPQRSPTSRSPFRSPQRPSLVGVASLPDIFSPTSARRRSPSPAKSNNLTVTAHGSTRPSLLQGPALGSAYRPVSFSASNPVAASNGIEPGRTRTYGGARSFRRDVEEEALLDERTLGETTKPNRSLKVDGTNPSSPHLPSLPPSLSNRISGKTQPATRETYSQLREKWGVDAEEALDDDEAVESQERGARVVGTGYLRAQGEGKRWNDEMGWVLEGLKEGKGGSGAKSSAIELLGKTLDREWMRRLKSSGMAEQVYLAFRRSGAGDGNRVLDVALVVLLAALSRDQRMCEPLFRLNPSEVSTSPSSSLPVSQASSSPQNSQYQEVERECELLKTLTELCTRDWVNGEIGTTEGTSATTTATKSKISKSDARQLQSLRDVIVDSELCDGTIRPTFRNLILRTLQTFSSFTPRSNFQPQQLMCTSGAFEAVISALIDHCAPLDSRIAKYETGLDLLPPPSEASSTISLSSIAVCLSIFETTSLSTPLAFHLASSPRYLSPLSKSFVDLLRVTTILAQHVDASEEANPSSKLLVSVLGAIFGLSTESPWAEGFLRVTGSTDEGIVAVLIKTALSSRRSRNESSRPRTTSIAEDGVDRSNGTDSASEPQHPGWDILCLVLGTLTNLVESCEDTKDALRETRVDPDCEGKRKCARRCTCDDRSSVLVILSQLYLDPLDDAPNTVYRTSVAGFLRLLLGLSIVDNPRNESIVLEALESGPPSATTGLIDAIDEFGKLHEEQKQIRGMFEMDEEEGSTQIDSSAFQDEYGEAGMEEVGRDDVGANEDVAKRIRETVDRLRRRF